MGEDMKLNLDLLYARYNKRALVSPDPLQFLYAYKNIRDREIAGLIAASFAYGNVKQIIKNVGGILEKMAPGPYKFITSVNFDKKFKGFKYRFTTERELVVFLKAIKKVIKKYGSLEKCFLAYYSKEHENAAPALRGFAAELRSHGDISTLIPDPDKKSALKRLNLFLRWMARKDEVDPGGWKGVKTAHLIVPLDTHMHKISLRLGLNDRRQADMRAAVKISGALARFCAEDPVKYDFCLTRFGIRDDMDYELLDREVNK
jgi:uncharacterized protein (TIGR02757 family)